MAALNEQALIFSLRHPPGCATHALIGAAFVGEGPDVPPAIDRCSDDFAACLGLDALDGDVGGWFEAIGGLSYIAERLVGYFLTRHAIRQASRRSGQAFTG